MRTALPIILKRDIAREVRLGEARTDDAVLQTLKRNEAVSKGLRVDLRAAGGQLGGSQVFYCALNRDAARAFRHKNIKLAKRYAKAAQRVEDMRVMKALTNAVQELSVVATPRGLADALAAPPLIELVRGVEQAIERERGKLPSAPSITQLSGRVISIDDDAAVVELDDAGTWLPLPRSVLQEEGLDEQGAALAARWDLVGDGMMIMSVEPVIDAPAVNSIGAPLVDMYGTPWGRILMADDADFVQEMLARPESERKPLKTRSRIPIGE